MYIIFVTIELKLQRNGEKKIKEGGVLFCGKSGGRDDVTLTI